MIGSKEEAIALNEKAAGPQAAGQGLAARLRLDQTQLKGLDLRRAEL